MQLTADNFRLSKESCVRNNKVRTITDNTSMYLYPDILKWMAEVDFTFRLMTKVVNDLMVVLTNFSKCPKSHVLIIFYASSIR